MDNSGSQPSGKLGLAAARLLEWCDRTKRSLKKRPALALAVGFGSFLLVVLLDIITNLWSLFSGEPLIPYLINRAPFLFVPGVQLSWTTVIGLLLLLILIHLVWKTQRLVAEETKIIGTRITTGAVPPKERSDAGKMRAVLILLILLLLLGIFQTILGLRSRSQTSELHGVLIPANEVTPPLLLEVCKDIPLGPDDVMLSLGGGLVGITHERQIPLTVGGDEVFKIERTAAGASISGRIISSDKAVIAQITNNELFINPSNFFYAERPNWHTLIVKDKAGKEVLYMFYYNPKSILVRGSFYSSKGTPVIINQEAVTVVGATRLTLSGICLIGKINIAAGGNTITIRPTQ